MRSFFAVLKKELRVTFVSPLAWVFLVAFLFLAGLFFYLGVATTGAASLRTMMANLSIALLFLLPEELGFRKYLRAAKVALNEYEFPTKKLANVRAQLEELVEEALAQRGVGREEALDELHQFQRLHREAAEEAKAILKNAEATAERIRENAEATAKETIKRREQQATAKIRAAETAMINELREKAASLAVASAAQIITSKLDDKAGLALIDEAAGEIEKLN